MSTSNFITVSEVLSIAFRRDNVDKKNIPSDFIEMCEENYIRPALGDTLFDRLNTSSPSPAFTAQETAVLSKIKKPLAYYVKHEVLPELSVKISNSGMSIINSHQAEAGDAKARSEMRQATLRTAEQFMLLVKRYLEDNKDDLSNFKSGEDSHNEYKMHGGIIL